MKKLLAAVLILGGAVASAETLVADIPFAFHIPGAQLPAGKYAMTRSEHPNFDAFFLRGVNSSKSYIVATPVRTATGQMRQSKISFRCASEGACELSEIQSAVQGIRSAVRPSLKRVPATEISWRTVSITAAD